MVEKVLHWLKIWWDVNENDSGKLKVGYNNLNIIFGKFRKNCKKK